MKKLTAGMATVPQAMFRLRHLGPRRVPLALVALALAAGYSAPASADHSFEHAEYLGKSTDWDLDGKTHVGNIPDVEGDGQNHFRFSVEVAGPIWAWTTGGFSPYLRIFDQNRMPLTRGRTSIVAELEEPGDYYVVASSSSAGAYRLRIAGGGEGHDDVGNVEETATSLTLATGTLSNPAEPSRLRIDYEEDRDYFKFAVPEGSRKWVRIWTSGSSDTNAWMWDSYGVELESDRYSGDGSNFFIDRELDPGTYYLLVRGATGPYRLHLTGADDHGNLFQTASRVELHSETTGSLDYREDRDTFWFQVSTRGSVEIRSSGNTNTGAYLYDSDEIELERNDDSGAGGNFLIDRTLEPGTYYVAVTDTFYSSRTGPYTLHLSGEASGAVSVPLFPALANALEQQGFVRIINHSGKEVEEVKVTAYDDTGMAAGSFTLWPPELSPVRPSLAAWETVHFNSRDLELGNPAKGIASGAGSGTGNWYLEVAPSEPEVEVLSYIRTSDGFLTSMHALAPSYGREHRVAVFNPGSNRAQASRLRLIHPKCSQGCYPANVTIFGVDDKGKRSPDVEFDLASGAACEVTAAQLEGLDGGPGCLENTPSDANRLHDGAGKWQLFVSADQSIHIMSLLQSETGHLTNLSAITSSQIFSAPDSQQAD